MILELIHVRVFSRPQILVTMKVKIYDPQLSVRIHLKVKSRTTSNDHSNNKINYI